MKYAAWILAAGLTLAGCTVQDGNPDWQPDADYPPWAYDAPFYYRPTDELPVVEKIDDLPIYHSCSDYFFVKHPGGQQLPGEPRIAVWASTDHGQTWERAGYFGVEQTHFLFRAEADGEHWIRFIGPGQGTTTVPPGRPHRIYIVDRQPPRIMITVDPGCWMDQGKTKPRTFKVGQPVTVHWQIADEHLDAASPKLEMCYARFPYNKPWLTLPEKPGRTGSMTIELPAEAAEDGGVRFRLLAKDLAGNVGMGMTDVLQLADGKEGKLRPEVTPVGPDDLLAQTHGTPAKRVGWPDVGELLRGNEKRVLVWMPEGTDQYNRLELQLTPNSSRSWQTIAKPQTGHHTRWTVPAINSKNCSLRIVGVKVTLEDKTEKRFVLAQTGRFTITTPIAAPPDGPRELIIEEE